MLPSDSAAASIIDMSSGLDAKLWGLVVTFRRLESLAEMLNNLQGQTHPPAEVVVVDNGSDALVEDAAAQAGAIYLDAGDNLGPAGGIALGMQHILQVAGEDDWIVVLDDDDPPESQEVFERLLSFAEERRSNDPSTAAVGTVGARYDRRSGRFQRVPDQDLHGAVPVDYIGGGQLPIYACAAIRQVGVPDPSLFFGFDDADLGLRLKESGFSLWADGSIWRSKREQHGRLNLRARPRTPAETPAWRRYYSLRNALILARRYGGPTAPIQLALVGAPRDILALWKAYGLSKDLLLPIRASVDGLLSRGGKRVDPARQRT